jgi:hypothetical protein
MNRMATASMPNTLTSWFRVSLSLPYICVSLRCFVLSELDLIRGKLVCERRAVSRERRAKSGERRAKSRERRAERGELNLRHEMRGKMHL